MVGNPKRGEASAGDASYRYAEFHVMDLQISRPDIGGCRRLR